MWHDQKINQAASILGLVLCAVLAYVFWKAGLFDSKEALTSCISRFGWAGPGGVHHIPGRAGGHPHPARRAGVSGRGHPVRRVERLLVQLYRHLRRSMAAFAIARACGRPLLESVFPAKMIEKYDRWMGSGSRFAKWFAFLIFIPVAPDDYLCFLAGTTRIGWRLYAAIILLCKPASIALYSLGLTVVAQNLLGLWR